MRSCGLSITKAHNPKDKAVNMSFPIEIGAKRNWRALAQCWQARLNSHFDVGAHDKWAHRLKRANQRAQSLLQISNSPAVGKNAAFKITGQRHVPLAALQRLYTNCPLVWKRVQQG